MNRYHWMIVVSLLWLILGFAIVQETAIRIEMRRESRFGALVVSRERLRYLLFMSRRGNTWINFNSFAI